jgi:hypothetical protein
MSRRPGMYNYRGMRGLGQGMYQTSPQHPMQGLGQGEPLSVAQRNAAQRALEQRELVKQNIGENIWTDLTSGKTYKIAPFTITNASLDAAPADIPVTATGETTWGKFTVPVGTELMFAKPRFARGDIESPHCFGVFADPTSPTPVNFTAGIVRVRVFDSQNHYEKFVPLEVSMEKFNAASAIDIDQRIYFNSQTPGRAVAGDVVRIALDFQGTAPVGIVEADNSRFTMELIRLSVIAG